jgi:uncharacterized protein YkwD
MGSDQRAGFGFNGTVRFLLRMTRFRRSRHLRTRLVCGLAIALAALPAGRSQQLSAPADTESLGEQYLLSAANQERSARGLSPLHRNPQLARAAAGHAREMAAHEAISHQFPGEAELTDRGARAGVPFSAISENVAEAPNVVQIHDMWMHSEHHRDNLLDPSIDSAGISVVERGGEFYAVEDFARTVRAVSLEDQESAIAALLAQRSGIALANDPARVSAARKTCSMSSGWAGEVQPWFVMRFTSASLDQIPGELVNRMASGRYHQAAVGACPGGQKPFTSYNFAVLLYP